MSTIKIPKDKNGTTRIEIMGPDVRSLDEIVVGNWLHLERMDGVNKRIWWLGLTDERGEVLHVYIEEKDGFVKRAHVTEGWTK